MVDFNNEATIGTPAIDITRVLLLQRQNDVVEAVEHINKLDGTEQSEDINIIRARMFSLYLQMSGMLKRQLKPEQIDILKEVLKKGNKEELIEQLLILNDVLDNIKLTRIDTKVVYNSTYVEKENDAKSL